MRNSVCKAIRKKLWGDKSRRTKRFSRLDTGQIVHIDLVATYRKHKRAWNRLTEAEKRREIY